MRQQSKQQRMGVQCWLPHLVVSVDGLVQAHQLMGPLVIIACRQPPPLAHWTPAIAQ